FARYEYDDHVREALDYAIRYASTKDIAVKEYVRRWLPVYRKHQKLAANAYRAVTGRNP
ncbi:MAG: hypothetical protein JWM31_3595, partial [Solirubrobacterales bacterium]|nr:hypothetical protein [Solirubrobacterales bacterium]